MNKIMTIREECIKYNFVAPLKHSHFLHFTNVVFVIVKVIGYDECFRGTLYWLPLLNDFFSSFALLLRLIFKVREKNFSTYFDGQLPNAWITYLCPIDRVDGLIFFRFLLCVGMYPGCCCGLIVYIMVIMMTHHCLFHIDQASKRKFIGGDENPLVLQTLYCLAKTSFKKLWKFWCKGTNVKLPLKVP